MIKAPSYLRKETREWFNSVLKEYEMQDHHRIILTLACECLDRITEARLQIKKDGAYFKDRLKTKPHPALKIESENKIIFARLLRELNLDVESPGAVGRPPGLYK